MIEPVGFEAPASMAESVSTLPPPSTTVPPAIVLMLGLAAPIVNGSLPKGLVTPLLLPSPPLV